MADIEINMGKFEREEIARIVAWLLLVSTASWGFNLSTWNIPAYIAYMPVWGTLTYVMFDSVLHANKWMKLEKALIKGAKVAKAEWEKNREVTKGVAEIINEQARKKN